MDKKQIINILKKYNFDKDKYVVISGAAMVLLDIKEKTRDIDIAVTPYFYQYLIKKYDCKLQKETECGKIYYIDDVINFGLSYYSDEKLFIDNIPIQTIEELLNLKKLLNRKKDIKDIKLIENYRSR